MKFDPEIHRRRSIRLKGFDYASAGAYFVTVCVQGRACLFGEIKDGEMLMNEVGGTVNDWWRKIPEKFGNVRLDKYVVMPNHFHGLVTLVGADPRVCPGLKRVPVGADPRVCPVVQKRNPGGHMGPGNPGGHTGPGNPGGHTGPPLPRIIQWFKTMTTNAYLRGVTHHNWPPFPGCLWQRNYYERVIRDENELFAARQYIQNNPLKWAVDADNPVNQP